MVHRFLASLEFLSNNGYPEALMLMMLFISVGWLHGTGNPIMEFHFHSQKVSLAISKPKQPWKIIVKAMIQDNPDHPVYLSNYTMCVYIYIYLYSYIYVYTMYMFVIYYI